MTIFTVTTTIGSGWWARSLTTTAIMTTGPTAGGRAHPQPSRLALAPRLGLLLVEAPDGRRVVRRRSNGVI